MAGSPSATTANSQAEFPCPRGDTNPARNPSRTRQRRLFIVGFYRSGTSLLYSFLNLHPQIKLVYEADILGNPLLSASSWSGQKWWETLDFFNACVRRHQLSPLPCWKEARTIRERADLLYGQYAGTGPLYLGEKCPAYYNRLRCLAHLYPDAHFICIWRNPLGVTSSIFNAGKGNSFFRKGSLYIRALIGLEQLQDDTLALRRQGRAVLDLCYEDLVDDPESRLRDICRFLEIEFEPGMLELKNADNRMFPPGEHHAKAKCGQVTPTVHAPEPELQAIHAKAHRYLARWRKRFGNKLASQRYWNEATGLPPGPGQIFGDRLSYFRKQLINEILKPALFGLVPRCWLENYRRSCKNADV